MIHVLENVKFLKNSPFLLELQNFAENEQINSPFMLHIKKSIKIVDVKVHIAAFPSVYKRFECLSIHHICSP